MKEQSNEQKPLIDQNLLNACIHCGLCLPSCPTYLATGRELESPRGRIYLLNLWQQNKAPFSKRMAEHLDSCLGCFGCQTACPSGVNYEAIFNNAKVQVNSLTPIWYKLPRYLALRWLLPNDILLKLFASILRAWQQVKADYALGRVLLLLDKMQIAKEVLRWQSLLPSIPKHKNLALLTTGANQASSGVHLFKGCIMDIFYNHVNRECIDLLALCTSQVCVPEQTCCGALALHSGEKNLACYLAKKNIDKFGKSDDPIIATASGCAAMLKSYPELFSEDDIWHDKAKVFSKRIKDLPEFLAQYEFESVSIKNIDKLKPFSIGYHAACHLSHAQGIRVAPKILLENFAQAVNKAFSRQIVNIVPLIEEEYCCGSAGIYNLGHPILSERILARKLEMIKESGVSIIVTTNPGCMLQLQSGINAQGLGIQVLHLSSLLSKAYLSSF
jgi:glycolate oxidase iron-sulfur subunit